MSANDHSEEEDDYLSMVIAEPEQPKFETSAQRRARQKREAEVRARPKTKSEQAEEQVRSREDALATKIDESSKGFKMLSKLGYKPGTGLGAQDHLDPRLEPIGIEIRDKRTGIGADTERKRKLRDELESETKRVKADEGDYRERVAKEREDRRNEGLWRAAMAVLEKLDEDQPDDPEARKDAKHNVEAEAGTPESRHLKAMGLQKGSKATKPLASVNPLYRSLVKQRLIKEREQRLRHDLNQSLSASKRYIEDAEDEGGLLESELFDDLESEDSELDRIEALDPGERLTEVVDHLRQQHHYCFWCKSRYPDERMEDCPGPLEEDHD